MEVLQKKNKGFTLLELLVVLAIVSVVTAIGIPNFNSWRSDREVRVAAVKLTNLFTEVYNHTQGSAYPFTQVLINSKESEIVVTGHGMTTDQYSTVLYNNNNSRPTCEVGSKSDAWSNIKVRPLRTDNVLFDFVDTVGICFSKRTSHYNVNAETTSFGENAVILCLKAIMLSREFDRCDIEDIKKKGTNYSAYQVEWSRFGKINMYKYNHRTNEWILQ